MKTKWTSMLAASVLIAAAGAVYYRNASHGFASNKADLRDAANSPNVPMHKRSPAHGKLTVQAASQDDAQPQQLSQKVTALTDADMEAVAKLVEQAHTFVVREAYPSGEAITKTNIRDNAPSFNTVGTVNVAGPMDHTVFGQTASNRVVKDTKAGNMSSADSTSMSTAIYRISTLVGDNYQFYTVHFVNDEDGDSLDAVIVDRANNQTLGFTIDGGE